MDNRIAARRRLLLAPLVVLGLAGCASQGMHANQHASLAHANPTRDGTDGPNRSRSTTPGLKIALRDYYRKWAGTPYRYGGHSSRGIDCSSFVQHAMSAVESFPLPRTTSAQARIGEQIPRYDLSPGDLVFFKTGHSSRHVGIYLGNDRFMHASSSQGVTISRLDNVYWRTHYWQSRRLN